MRLMLRVGFAALPAVLASLSLAQAAKPVEKPAGTNEPTIAEVLNTSVLHLQRIMLPMAMAMPDDKFNFAPTSGEFNGVRTFGEQLKHVATTNYSLASAVLGEKPPVDLGDDEAGPASVKSKKEILKYLNDSFAYVQKAVAATDAKNVVTRIKNPFGGETTRLALITLIISNCYDHYGQLTQYLRMNGVVPPASQRE